MESTIFPSCSPASRRSCAARISASGSATRSTWTPTRPVRTSSYAPRKSSRVPIVEPHHRQLLPPEAVAGPPLDVAELGGQGAQPVDRVPVEEGRLGAVVVAQAGQPDRRLAAPGGARVEGPRHGHHLRRDLRPPLALAHALAHDGAHSTRQGCRAISARAAPAPRRGPDARRAPAGWPTPARVTLDLGLLRNLGVLDDDRVGRRSSPASRRA